MAALVYGIGATKAGTSWLYRALHDHPGCAVRAVKEWHYWDTFEAEARDRQVAASAAQLERYRATRAEAEVAGRGWQVANMDRRIADMAGLVEVLSGDRTDDAGYRAYAATEDGRLAADMTPAYATLPEDCFARMAALGPATRFVYLVRDPVARLWSHVRMQAERFRQAHETFELKANRILWRLLHKGQETHILARGDYPATVERLRRTVPEGRLRVEFMERLVTPDGWAAMCRFLGIAELPVAETGRVHEGPAAPMRDDLRPLARTLLKDHYDWAAREIGPLPAAWRANL